MMQHNENKQLKITSLFDKFEPDMSVGGLFGNINQLNKAKSTNQGTNSSIFQNENSYLARNIR